MADWTESFFPYGLPIDRKGEKADNGENRAAVENETGGSTMKAIVYTSKTGTTKRYAEMLSAETGLPAYALNAAWKSLAKGSEIIYMGWIMANNLKGYKKAAKRYTVRAACAVGMGRPSAEYPGTVKTKNRITDIPLFYLQAGLNLRALHGISGLMIKMVAKTYAKSLQEKAQVTEEEAEALDMLQNGADKVNAENLTEVLLWANEQE
jgi:hypothetical protein